tara:strand:- start:1834 stop:2448 length:615 start_codon:yes stop_codon:yes gene_type:complete
MSITINGNGTVTGLAVGGLPNGTVDADTLAANAVTTNKIANSAVTPVKSTITGGISMYDEWRLSASGSGTGTISSNWERNDTNFTNIGSGMTESSGIFTFPSTGIYLIQYHLLGYRNGDALFFGNGLYLSTDGGSNWNFLGFSRNANTSGGDSWASAASFATVDVTDASNFKIKMNVDTYGTWNWVGYSTYHGTCMSFMKLGET